MIYLLCDKILEACPLQTPFFNCSRVDFVRRFDSAKLVPNCHSKSQNSALSILKVLTFNRNTSKLQVVKVRHLPEPDSCISSHHCKSGSLECLICKFRTDRAVIGRGRKTFKLWIYSGCIFIKVAAAIRKLKACIGSKINEKDTKKEIIILLKASQELIA